MPRAVTAPDLLRTLPATGRTRLAYSWQRKPWTPGYYARVRTEATANLVGFNYPGSLAQDKVERVVGKGAANNATQFTYTTRLTVPAAASVTAGADYLKAVIIIYPGFYRRNGFQAGDDGSFAVAERLADGAAFTAAASVTGPVWKRTGANTIEIAWKASGGNYVDLPKGWIAELIIPAATDISTIVAATGAGEVAAPLQDFLCADTGAVTVNRVMA